MYRHSVSIIALFVILPLGGIRLVQNLSARAPSWPAGLPVVTPTPCAPTNVGGFITSDTTWDRTCGPYIATASIIVMEGATLTIAPGVTVRFDSLKALTVQGTLVARGTEADPITFTSNVVSPAKGDWGYIHFADSSTDAAFDGSGNYTGGSIIQYAIIEYAGGTSITENGALRIEAAAPFINHNAIRDNKAEGVHIWNNGMPRITNNTISNNSPGRGIHISNSTVTISGNTISGNSTAPFDGTASTDDLGAGIYVNSGNSTINNNIISGNRAADGGGGIYVYYGASTISGNTIFGNSAAAFGGGIYVNHNTAMISDNIISDNVVNQGGGGIFVYNGTATIRDNTVSGNAASGGGGISVSSSGTATISGNTITSNSVSGIGGGISVNGSVPTISNNTITNNSANGRGGGVFLCNECRPNINDNDIYNNTSTYGSDLYNGNAYGGADLNAENNYWGTTDSGVIEEHVWHFFDDSSLGLVDYIPYYNEPINPTPMPIPTPTPTPTSSPMPRTGRVFLPLLRRDPPRFVTNGSFETADFTGWTVGATSEAFRVQVVREGRNHIAMLGDPSAHCNGGSPHNGAAWFYQTITVPVDMSPVFSFKYRVLSQDDERFEALDVYVRDEHGSSLDQVLHAGAPQPATLCDGSPLDSGWQERRFSLILQQGQTVQLYFELRSRDDQPYFNTWAYVDDVRVSRD